MAPSRGSEARLLDSGSGGTMMGPDDDVKVFYQEQTEGKTDRREPVTTNSSHRITAGSLAIA